MKLLARILSHGFAIAVVLLLAIGFIYRGELFPEYDLPGFLGIGKLADRQKESTTDEVGRDVVEAQADAPAPAAADDRGQTAMQGVETDGTGEISTGGSPEVDVVSEDVTEPGAVEDEVTVQEPASVDSLQSSPAIQPEAPSVMAEEESGIAYKEPASDTAVQLPVDTGQQPAVEPSAVDVTPEDESATTATGLPVSEVMPEDDSGEAEPAAPSSDYDAEIPQDTEAAVQVAMPQEKAYQLLADAREAYWLREYDTAESKYLSLTQLDPDNPDGYGELGNMYFSQGKWDQAAAAYYAAGVRLVGQGLLEQAEELIAVIRGLNGANANDLEQKIAGARSAASE